MLIAVIVMIIFVTGVVVGNMLPVFTSPVRRLLPGAGDSAESAAKRKSARRVDLLERKMKDVGWYLGTDDKKYIDETIRKGEKLDIVHLSTPTPMREELDGESISAEGLLNAYYSAYVDINTLTLAEKSELLKECLDHINDKAEEYIATNYGLGQTLNESRVKYGRSLSNTYDAVIEASVVRTGSSSLTAGESWDQEFNKSMEFNRSVES